MSSRYRPRHLQLLENTARSNGSGSPLGGKAQWHVSTTILPGLDARELSLNREATFGWQRAVNSKFDSTVIARTHGWSRVFDDPCKRPGLCSLAPH